MALPDSPTKDPSPWTRLILKRRLNPLPIAALCLPGQTISSLKKLGFETIAEVKATARPPLALRFGSEIGRRLDETSGMTFKPFNLVQHPDAIFTGRAFAEPYVTRCGLLTGLSVSLANGGSLMLRWNRCAITSNWEDEAGERFWVFRAGDGILANTGSQKWFLHGVFA